MTDNKFSLLKDLEEKSSSETKTIYQTYDIKLGFESIKVYIPEDNSTLFEDAIGHYKGVSSYDVDKIAKTFNGYIKE